MNHNAATQLQELWDREQIRQCIHRYARGVDRFDREMILSAFHDDFLDEHGKFVGNGDEFVEWALEQHGRVHLTHQHILANHTCEIAGATAHAETYFIFAGMNRKGPPLTLLGGRYLDRLEKRGGDWRISARITVRDWANLEETPDMRDLSSFTSTCKLLSDIERAFMNAGHGPARDRSDPSYDRPISVAASRRAEYIEKIKPKP